MSVVSSVLSSLFVVSALITPAMSFAAAPASQQLASVDLVSPKLKALNITVNSDLVAGIGALSESAQKDAVGVLSDGNLVTYLNSKEGSVNGNKVALYLLQYLNAKQNGAFNGVKAQPNLAKLAQEYAEGGEVISTVTQMFARFNVIMKTGAKKDPRMTYLGVRRSFFKEQAETMGLAKTIDGKVGSKLTAEENEKAVQHAQEQEKALQDQEAANDPCGV